MGKSSAFGGSNRPDGRGRRGRRPSARRGCASSAAAAGTGTPSTNEPAPPSILHLPWPFPSRLHLLPLLPLSLFLLLLLLLGLLPSAAGAAPAPCPKNQQQKNRTHFSISSYCFRSILAVNFDISQNVQSLFFFISSLRLPSSAYLAKALLLGKINQLQFHRSLTQSRHVHFKWHSELSFLP